MITSPTLPQRNLLYLSVGCALASPDIHVSHWDDMPLIVAEAVDLARRNRCRGYP